MKQHPQTFREVIARVFCQSCKVFFSFSLSNCQLSNAFGWRLGQDVFVASLPQIKMLIRAQGDQVKKLGEQKSWDSEATTFPCWKREILTLQWWIDFSIDGTEATRLDSIMWLACRLCSVMCGSQRESLIGVVLAKPDHQGASKQRSQRQFLWRCAFLVWAVDLKPFFVDYCS